MIFFNKSFINTSNLAIMAMLVFINLGYGQSNSAKEQAQKNYSWQEIYYAYQKKIAQAETDGKTKGYETLDIKSLYNLSICCIQLNKLEEAQKYLDFAIKLEPNKEQIWLAYGQLSYRKKKFYLALSQIAKAIDLNPNNYESRNFISVTAKALGWEETAEEELLKAIELNPAYADAHYNLALIYMSRKPVPAELLKRHYMTARDLGVSPDEKIEDFLKSKKQ